MTGNSEADTGNQGLSRLFPQPSSRQLFKYQHQLHLQLFHCPSSCIMTETKKIGGEYGSIRAGIDIPALNAYLAKHVPAVKAPVEVKQFKVRGIATR